MILTHVPSSWIREFLPKRNPFLCCKGAQGHSGEFWIESSLSKACVRGTGIGVLVAPYCAIPRDYLSDTPLLRAMGFFAVSTWPKGCDTPSPFFDRFPLGEHAKWRCDTPPQKGYLSDTCTIPYENKANGCDTPLCDTISKGYCAIRGDISHWAAKPLSGVGGIAVLVGLAHWNHPVLPFLGFLKFLG